MSNKFDTRLIHGTWSSEPPSSEGIGVAPSIEMSTTFLRDDPREDSEFIYSRTSNPNWQLLEQRLCSLENGTDAIALATGSAASLALFQALPQNSHIIVTHDSYFGTVLQLNELVTHMGHSVTPVDTKKLDNVTAVWKKNTRLVWLETPSNPQMGISDIKAIADFAHANDAHVCCDNTLATSVWQQPLALGADFSMHSSTKFLGGHSDVMGGVIIAREPSKLFDRVRQIQSMGGAVPSPFDCWLLLRSIATLGVRVRQQTASANTLARYFVQHKSIEQVLYAGLESHPGYETNQAQMEGGGALFSLLIKGTREQAINVARSTRLIKQATSLGGVESLIEHRHSVEGATTVSPPNLLRLSIGLEDPSDLIEDLEQALGSIE